MACPACVDSNLVGYRYSDEFIDITNKLMDIDQATRLGRYGIMEIKAHRFFRGFNWEKLRKKEIEPPYSPKVADDN